MSLGLGKIEAMILREIGITLGDFVPDPENPDRSRAHKCILISSLELAKALMPPRAVGEPVKRPNTSVRGITEFCG
jgi:hypothetical protein